ncbi:type VII secretion target [Actinokineospora bangkokensis]|uniref:ESX-1 secretion-associated protein n=1 Tax=Actinokineospora bangkokensis TaxID=1193682 RepID=A0A1Q9LFB0_9PSEU|nr:type VII secretion target [Actinokineospora bangkokensis]OLR90722.1 hypothetical protein BJP25_29450 [Actinokineospora bangkokensis]
MSQFHVETDQLRGYAGLLERNAGHLSAIEGHARTAGGDTSGFTGLLELLVPVVDGAVALYAQALEFGHDRMVGLQHSLEGAADAYDKADATGAARIGGVETVRSIPTVGGR